MNKLAVLIGVLAIISIANATTITLFFDDKLFENETLRNMTTTANLSYLTTPEYVVDGFKLRGEDFVNIDKGYFRTYNTSDNNTITVFEIWAWEENRVNSKTQELNGLIAEQAKTIVNKTAEVEEWKGKSAESALSSLYVLAGIVFWCVCIFVAIVIVVMYRKKHGEGAMVDWKPEMEHQATDDEFVAAMTSIDRW